VDTIWRIDGFNFYNHARWHSTLGYVSPITFLGNAAPQHSSKTQSPHNWRLRSLENGGKISSYGNLAGAVAVDGADVLFLLAI